MLLKYFDLCQQISNNLKINYLFVVNRRVNTKDKLREASLFSVFCLSKYLLTDGRGRSQWKTLAGGMQKKS